MEAISNATMLHMNSTFEALLHGQSCLDGEAPPRTLFFHVANAFFVVSFCSPNTRLGQVLLHTGLLAAFLLLSTWAWNVICAPVVFAWHFVFAMLNLGQLLYILYQLRPIRFDPDLDHVYTALFEPFRVSRVQFKRLVGGDSAQVVSLHAGECYAVEGMTKTDRLGLLLVGEANVLNEKSFLHHVKELEFLDSPEFESSNSEETFKVTICAATTGKYVLWQRTALDYLFVKEPQLAQAMAAILARDITEKLLVMNSNLKTAEGHNVDLRLPAIANRLCQMENRQHAIFRTNNK